MSARVEIGGRGGARSRARTGSSAAAALAARRPPDESLDDVEPLIEQALAEADAEGVAGQAVTPFVLACLHRESGGRTLAANRELDRRATRGSRARSPRRHDDPRGRADEVDEVLAVWRAAGSPPSVTDSAEHVLAAIVRDGTWLLVAEEDGRIVGTLIAAWDGWRGNLYRLAVLPEAAPARHRDARSSPPARSDCRPPARGGSPRSCSRTAPRRAASGPPPATSTSARRGGSSRTARSAA